MDDGAATLSVLQAKKVVQFGGDVVIVVVAFAIMHSLCFFEINQF